MCGLAGQWEANATMPAARAEEIGLAMARAIAHRGPDDAGAWVAPGGPCLAHRRLSIIDLSPGGHQPMVSGDRRYVIAFNGEIYNFSDLRHEVEDAAGPVAWRGHSDTEVLLEAISAWGLMATLPRLNGMFAIALWDAESKTLTLARDRFGEKPLYYGYAANSFIFGSELKALYAHPDWSGRLDADAVADFLRFCYVPAPRSIFLNVRKVMPGCCVAFKATEVASKTWPRSVPYWRARDVALSAHTSIADGSDDQLVAETERQLQRAVGLRMVADVPLGAFLSGGIDSSVVVAMMQSVSTQPVKTFSIGFNDERYNEANHAAQVAARLGTDHTQLYVSNEHVLDIIRLVPALYDEPFADSSQIPSVLVSRLARAHVTVALSGDGGDELFGGYNRHTWVPRISQMAGHLPQQIRGCIASFLLKRTPAELDVGFAKISRVLPTSMHSRTPGDKLHKLAGILGEGKGNDIYAGLISTIRCPQRFMATPAAGTDTEAMFPDHPGLSLAQWMMLSDTENYMPDDILAKVDRASMSVSLEARIPFLDPELYDWAWRLPMSMKIREGKGKWVLRQVLYRYVPQALVDRPKTGFGIPLDALLRGPLQQWARDLLSPDNLASQKVLDPQTVNQALNEHMAGETNNAYLLWNFLVLTSWIDAYRNRIEL
jgi:asparagine synthase (glutamine-hydrolysing)